MSHTVHAVIFGSACLVAAVVIAAWCLAAFVHEGGLR